MRQVEDPVRSLKTEAKHESECDTLNDRRMSTREDPTLRRHTRNANGRSWNEVGKSRFLPPRLERHSWQFLGMVLNLGFSPTFPSRVMQAGLSVRTARLHKRELKIVGSCLLKCREGFLKLLF